MNRTMARIALTLFSAVVSLSSITAVAQSFTILHTFRGRPGFEGPAQGLILDTAGNLYGTTFGFLDGSTSKNYGSVFKLDAAGKITFLQRFNGPNGSNPQVGHVIRDGEGNSYGVADAGGVLPGGHEGSGTVYKIDKNGKETVLHVFTGGADGDSPRGTLVRDKKGNLYGTTLGGNEITTFGAVYRLNTNGKLTVVHTFRRGTGDGDSPPGGLVADADGNLYGTTWYGGTATVGTVFKITKAGKESVLYSFKGGTDGNTPNGDLILDQAGNLYGTTNQGGASNLGTVFKVDPSGNETVLYSFKGPGPKDGYYPAGGVLLDDSGNLYGTTWAGGTSGSGAVFKLDPAGNETLLYSFAFGSQGSPLSTLVRDSAGNLYGVTVANPTQAIQDFGLVYKITP